MAEGGGGEVPESVWAAESETWGKDTQEFAELAVGCILTGDWEVDLDCTAWHQANENTCCKWCERDGGQHCGMCDRFEPDGEDEPVDPDPSGGGR